MEKDKNYFGENGITSTSANFIANQAKEMVQTVEEELDGTSFLNGKIGLIGGTFSTTSKGVTSLDYMSADLDQIVKAHSLIAWLREALKAKVNLQKEIANKSLEDWCKETNREYPEAPQGEAVLTKDDVLATWSIKDRNRYLYLSAKVSTYGKFLHPNGTFSDARKRLKQRINNPIGHSGSGRDTIIKSYEPSISPEEVDKKFYELQGIWRKAQAELNGYEHKIQLVLDEDANKKNSTYSQACSDYQKKMSSLNAEFKAWKDITLQQIAALKIVIPKDLEDIYKTVTELSK